MSPAKQMLISGHVDQGLPMTNKTEKLNKVKKSITSPKKSNENLTLLLVLNTRS
jgi:hypothetical protein